MHIRHSSDSTDHDPPTFFRRGKLIAHPESAERQEGGYLTPALPINLVTFLRQFDRTRGEAWAVATPAAEQHEYNAAVQ